MPAPHAFNGSYQGNCLDHLAFPLGGLGAGMFCLEGTGAFSHFSLRHRPDFFHEPPVFAAIAVKQPQGAPIARVLEGSVPAWKMTFPWDRFGDSSGMGSPYHHFGLPRFAGADFETRFPFGTVRLTDENVPLQASLVGWSPFVPGDEDASSLPVAALEYRFENPTPEPVEAVFSFHARNLMAEGGIGKSVTGCPNGFVLRQTARPDEPWREGAFAVWTEDESISDLTWFRGSWFDPLTMLWKSIRDAEMPSRGEAASDAPSPGGSLYQAIHLGPGNVRTIRILTAWYVPFSNLRAGYSEQQPSEFHRPWYAGKFHSIEEVRTHWNERVSALREATLTFSDCFYDTTLPAEVTEAVAANLTILKSPTVLRQMDGRMWAWEGSRDEEGSCHGTCTHVWNYAQAVPHLFPRLERTLRETEFFASQDESGHQNFRANLPIGEAGHDFHAACDGQLGGTIKVYRDWRISGDRAWLARLWPRVRASLDYCIRQWDPDHCGLPVEPHHNTYDIEFWGANGMCGSFYLAALSAAVAMGQALGEDTAEYAALLEKGRELMETSLFDGEYLIQQIQWEGLRAQNPVSFAVKSFHLSYSPEALALLEKEGPKYQYGAGCLSDGILGEWMAWTAGLPAIVDPAKTASHLTSVYRYNFRTDLSTHANPQRPAYAFGHEGGLLLCTWPKGAALSLPFVYSEEVWTGIEYHVASHLISLGEIEAGLEIVRTCRRRYDGAIRNPFGEFECGHWYARALSSYALLQALTGARYDAVDQVLTMAPGIKGDFRGFLATEQGFGTVGVKDGQPFLEVKSGHIPLKRIDYRP